jgi:predicted ATPase/class 3 adenylate cyclase
MDLPSGTVTMLFSDVEGSTVLLSRLGPAYADALDGQRQVLRAAWSAHGGTEMGTEGDSFFVVFATAPEAVAATVQAQRDLAGFPWPGGERVRVRIGVHTGNPTVHDGGYVGMDVHRAARIAGSAHGGQVVVSSATVELVGGNLPGGVVLRDLGEHQLKDIVQPEHLFQLVVDGLQAEFAPLKTLGAASTLPVPATPLMGRDGELAELTAVLRTPGVRLVTLTGPGGSGKTRLAIGLAQRLVEQFSDGVYFVPLAAVTSSDVMWTTIAEALDVPPAGRIPPGFFTHVAHRSALFILDSLEQIPDGDGVVAELLTQAPQVVVIATSRRPLHGPGEYEHPVPPLELPAEANLGDARSSGAVQLFVQHAQMVRPSFMLTDENTADVVTVCRRLDGLPLAIELAAARSKLLSPHALVARLDQALDITASGSHRPNRQKTLRDTIAWSYDLLTPAQQAFFRRLGVFAGGADLDAITAVTTTTDHGDGADPLDVVADLVDASLVTIGEDADGEPRIGMLETVRAYARDQLTAAGEVDIVRDRHADHYLKAAEELRSTLSGEQAVEARARFEADHDNYREALAWELQTGEDSRPASGDRVLVGLRLCRALSGFWSYGGYVAEARRWLGYATTRGGGSKDSLHLAQCLVLLARCLHRLGELDGARDHAVASVDMHRRIHDTSALGGALVTLASLESNLGRPAAARPLFAEAVAIARRSDDQNELTSVLTDFAIFEATEQNLERSLALDSESLAIARQIGNIRFQLRAQHNIACTMREMGRVEEAQQQMHAVIPAILRLNDPLEVATLAEDYAAILAELGDHARAVLLFGAADAMRERLALPRNPWQDAEIAEPAAKSRTALTAVEWDDAYQTGRNTTVEDALPAAHAMESPA